MISYWIAVCVICYHKGAVSLPITILLVSSSRSRPIMISRRWWRICLSMWEISVSLIVAWEPSLVTIRSSINSHSFINWRSVVSCKGQRCWGAGSNKEMWVSYYRQVCLMGVKWRMISQPPIGRGYDHVLIVCNLTGYSCCYWFENPSYFYTVGPSMMFMAPSNLEWKAC